MWLLGSIKEMRLEGTSCDDLIIVYISGLVWRGILWSSSVYLQESYIGEFMALTILRRILICVFLDRIILVGKDLWILMLI